MLAVLRVGVTLAVATGGLMLAVLRMGVSAAAPPLQVISYQSAGGRSETKHFFLRENLLFSCYYEKWLAMQGREVRSTPYQSKDPSPTISTNTTSEQV